MKRNEDGFFHLPLEVPASQHRWLDCCELQPRLEGAVGERPSGGSQPHSPRSSCSTTSCLFWIYY